MKKIAVTILSCLYAAAAYAGNGAERVYLSTDRQVYVAGESLRCSAWCLDSRQAAVSDVSAIAYIELHSSDGLACTGRVALNNGRGSAELELPRNIPSGNYKLIAYTALELDCKDSRPGDGATLISIINPYSTQRAGVRIAAESEYKSASETAASRLHGTGIAKAFIPASAKAGKDVEITLSSSKDADLAVSVYRKDGVLEPESAGIAGFLDASGYDGNAAGDRTAEYEGEIIEARVVGLDAEALTLRDGHFAFISAPGEKSDIYSAKMNREGRLRFFTNNIYGHKDLICEIEGEPSDSPAHLEIISPFADIDPGTIPEMLLCETVAGDLTQRAYAAQIEKAFASDTLFQYLPKRENLLFPEQSKTYILDDYTRFPTMEEVITEYIPELRARKDDGRRSVFVMMEDSYHNSYFSHGTALLMVDGVPIFDHERVLDYDPLLVKSINIYPSRYFIGARYYEGIVNFVTYKRNLPSMKFNPNVRIVDFQGASYPSAYTCEGVDADSYPDFRMTAYWHPIIEIKGGEDKKINVRIPELAGEYEVKIEGLAADGTPVMERYGFTAL